MNFSGIPPRSLLGLLLRAPLRIIPPSAVLPIVQGPLRGKKWSVASGAHGCWLGSYEYEKQQVFRRALTPGDVVFDIGANVGFYTLLAGVLVREMGHVYAFEPLRRNLEYLRKHLEMNRMRNCTVIDAAVSSGGGQARFDPSNNPCMGHLSAAGKMTVRTVALDSLVSPREIRPPDVMKIDVEGAELEVLRGCTEIMGTFRPIIFVATHGENVRQGCLRVLAANAYQVDSLDQNPAYASNQLVARRKGNRAPSSLFRAPAVLV